MLTEYLPVVISLTAIALAMLKVQALENTRLLAVFLALGAGQIYLAVLAILVFLLVGTGFRLSHCIPKKLTILTIILIWLIVLVSFTSPISLRILNELIQLVIYAIIFLLSTSYLEKQAKSKLQLQSQPHSSSLRHLGTHLSVINHMSPLLHTMLGSAVIVAIAGIFLNLTGITSTPHIYLGRGSNEGSLFLLLIGMIPCMSLFVATKKPIYLLCAFILLVAQVLALSRANIILSILLIACSPIYMLIHRRWLRALLILSVMMLTYWFQDNFAIFYDKLMNYSVLQRITLYEEGWALWLQSPWFGWGWGSSSALTPHTLLIEHDFPHFHSTYIQFIVELGLLGAGAAIAWVAGSFWLIFLHTPLRADSPGAALSGMLGIALFGSAFTDALLFGADRAIQIMLLFAVYRVILRLKGFNQTMGTDTPTNILHTTRTTS